MKIVLVLAVFQKVKSTKWTPPPPHLERSFKKAQIRSPKMELYWVLLIGTAQLAPV